MHDIMALQAQQKRKTDSGIATVCIHVHLVVALDTVVMAIGSGTVPMLW